MVVEGLGEEVFAGSGLTFQSGQLQTRCGNFGLEQETPEGGADTDKRGAERERWLVMGYMGRIAEVRWIRGTLVRDWFRAVEHESCAYCRSWVVGQFSEFASLGG